MPGGHPPASPSALRPEDQTTSMSSTLHPQLLRSSYIWHDAHVTRLNYLSRDRYSLTITPGHSPKLSQNARIVLTNASSRSLTTETELDPWRCKRFLRITPELMDPLRATYITLRLVPWGFAFCESNWGPL